MRHPAAEPGPISLDEYLQLEERSPLRHEYVDGRIYVLQGSTARHNRIASNIHARLNETARGGPCAAYVIDLKVRVGRDRVYYPDVVLVCAPHDGDTLVFDEPCVVVEVTSPSTRRTDRGEKVGAYLGIPSLRAYLVAEHDRPYLTLYTRAGRDAAWEREELVTAGLVTMPCVDAAISIEAIYAGVEFPPRTLRESDVDDPWLDPDDAPRIEDDYLV
ncbi:MAG TPA: Uma2 family endonuclease [Gemmatimonadaceae bacterium]|nr:Uma2 family endonuclease [Gemmatimonadaceae bacterium]